jgi:hypothetical protein
VDASKLTELADREAIRDCLYRYCRGVDRVDRESLKGAYWPDATDHHGRYSGSVSGFFDWAEEGFRLGWRNIHQIHNVLIEFQSGSTAIVESYFSAYTLGQNRRGGARQYLMAGRYCDVFEKRGQAWRIAKRVVVYDWVDRQTPPEETEAHRFGPLQPIGRAYPDDTIYSLSAG